MISELPPPADGQPGWPWTIGPLPLPPERHALYGWPKITIVTPSFNQGKFLEKTIRSVLLQGYPNLEYIIIDGGSTDNSVEIIRKYEPWLTYWVSEKDRGQSHALNKGFERATGELLGWLNSDDFYTEGALFTLASAYLRHPDAGAVYGRGHLVDERGAIINTPKAVPVTRETLFTWCYGNDFMQPSCLFSREAWTACGPLDEGIHIALDVDLWLKIERRFRFERINDILSVSVSHPAAKTTAFRDLMIVDLAIVIMRHGGERYARRILNEMADRLDWFEHEMAAIKRLPFVYRIHRWMRRIGGGRLTVHGFPPEGPFAK